MEQEVKNVHKIPQYPYFDESTYELMNKICTTHKQYTKNVCEFQGGKFVVFRYKRASNFIEAESRECRGSMFLVDDNEKFLKPMCRPFEKFFEQGQIEKNDRRRKTLEIFYGPHSKVPVEVYEKLDGSIVSSFVYEDKLYLKSNKVIQNEITFLAREYLTKNLDLEEKVLNVTKKGYTVIFELTSPKNRVVIEHKDTKLTIIGIRHVYDGHYWTHDEMTNEFGKEHIVRKVDMNLEDVNNISKMKDIEGFVALYDNGLRIKYKTEWYLEKGGSNQGKPSCDFSRVIEFLRSGKTLDEWDRVSFEQDKIYVIDKMQKYLCSAYDDAKDLKKISPNRSDYMKHLTKDNIAWSIGNFYYKNENLDKTEIITQTLFSLGRALNAKLNSFYREYIQEHLMSSNATQK